jgi:integrase
MGPMNFFKVNVHTLKDGTYQISYVDPGKQKRRRKSFDDYNEALSYRNQLNRQFSLQQFPPGTILVGHLIESFMHVNPKKLLERRKIFIDFCDTFNHYPLEKVTSESLEQWILDLGRRRNLSRNTLRSTKVMLNHFFKYLLDQGFLSDNPLAKVHLGRRQASKRVRVILSKEELKNTLSDFQKHSLNEVYPLIYTLALTGARLNEVRSLTWDCVDFENGTLHFHKTKNGKPRYVKMSPHLKSFLFLLPQKAPYIFCNRWGNLISAGQIGDTVRSFHKKFPGHKKWTCHDLRHSYAHNYLKDGLSMAALQAILGHRSIHMTVDYYAQIRAIDVEAPSPYDF